MAGIGFTLKKLFREESYIKLGLAFIYSSIITVGPWIFSVLNLGLLILVMDYYLPTEEEKGVFIGTIIYTVIFTQIIISPWQLVITRYIADKIYKKEVGSITPSFAGLTKILLAICLVVSIIFLFNKPLPMYYKLIFIYNLLVFLAVNILMIYLGAVKNYKLIVKAYILGGFVSILSAIFLLNNLIPFPTLCIVTNVLTAYLLGITATLLILLHCLYSSFYLNDKNEYDFLSYLNLFPSLIFTGICYSLGFWIDNIIMWFSDISVSYYHTFRYSIFYDQAVFFGYLTTLPAIVHFFVKVETELYDHFKVYYGLVNSSGTYKEILVAKRNLEITLYHNLLNTFVIQFLISMTMFLIGNSIFDFLDLGTIVSGIFRVYILGVFPNVFIIFIIILLLYFEARIRAFLTAFSFLLSNIIFTLYFNQYGINYYGFGFLTASFVNAVLAIFLLVTFMKNLNYVTFARQPLFYTEKQGLFIKMTNLLNRY